MYRIIYIAFLLFILSSCRELVQDEFIDQPQKPVVNCLLISGKPIEVYLSFTANIASEIQSIENSEIQLFVDDVLVENLEHTEKGLYTSVTVAEEGKTYTCKIRIPGYETIICSDSIPKSPSIFEIEHTSEAGRNEEGVTYPAIKIKIGNDTSIFQYFEVVIRLFVYDDEIIANLEKITDPLIINEGLAMALFSNQLINDSIYQLTINYTTGSQTGNNGIWHTNLFPFIVELRNVSYNYYQFAEPIFV